MSMRGLAAHSIVHPARLGGSFCRRFLVVPLILGLVLSGTLAGLAPAETWAAEQTHVVQSGETLRVIAARYGVSIGAIVNANGLTNPDLLRIGQVLVIPTGGGTSAPSNSAPSAPPPAGDARTSGGSAGSGGSGGQVTVQPGQTLGQIARDHGVTVGAIVEANGLRNADLIYPGQALVIPGGRAATQVSSRGASTRPAAEPATPSRPAGATRTFAVTMYCLQGRMANGQYVHVGAASADWSVLPLGIRIHVEGLGNFTIKDHYDRDLGALRLDIWEPSCARAIQWGIRRVNVTVLN